MNTGRGISCIGPQACLALFPKSPGGWKGERAGVPPSSALPPHPPSLAIRFGGCAPHCHSRYQPMPFPSKNGSHPFGNPATSRGQYVPPSFQRWGGAVVFLISFGDPSFSYWERAGTKSLWAFASPLHGVPLLLPHPHLPPASLC